MSLCCPQQPSSVSTATQFATELIGSLMSQERCLYKKKKGTRIFLSPRTPIYLLKKKKKFCCSQRASFRPFPSHPSLSQIPTTSLLSYITAFLGVMVVFFFFFFEGTNFHLLISQLKKKKNVGVQQAPCCHC